MASPGYTVKDLVYYIGFIGGLAGTYLALGALDQHNIVRLLVGMVVGMGLGWAAEKAFAAAMGDGSGGTGSDSGGNGDGGG